MASDLGLHCLSISHKRNVRIIQVNNSLHARTFVVILLSLFSTFSKTYFRSNIRVSNSLELDQIGSDLDPNCFQRLSADDIVEKRKVMTFKTKFQLISIRPNKKAVVQGNLTKSIIFYKHVDLILHCNPWFRRSRMTQT